MLLYFRNNSVLHIICYHMPSGLILCIKYSFLSNNILFLPIALIIRWCIIWLRKKIEQIKKAIFLRLHFQQTCNSFYNIFSNNYQALKVVIFFRLKGVNMKKVLTSVALGCAFLFSFGAANVKRLREFLVRQGWNHNILQ